MCARDTGLRTFSCPSSAVVISVLDEDIEKWLLSKYVTNIDQTVCISQALGLVSEIFDQLK